MKKYTILLTLLFMVFIGFGNIQTAHATMPVACNDPSAPSYPEYYTNCVSGSSGTTTVNETNYYVSYLDQYRMDYDAVPNSTNYRLHFVAANGTVYNADYNFSPTGTHYLTCNGTYSLQFFNSSNTLIASTNEVTTTAIVNPTCSSYADQTGKNDLSVTATNGVINWQPNPNAVNYEIYKDGVKISETTGTQYNTTAGGSYSIVAKDTNGAIVGQSDINIVSNPTPTPTPTPTCDTCQKLSDLLACPDWNRYMGDLTNAVSAAIPPPPNWDDVANKIGNSVITKLSDYVGQVPNTPTVNDIKQNVDTSLPSVDNSSTTAQGLIPSATEFNSPQPPFDITSAPVISIVDNSKPFSIPDPLNNITYDQPNVPVFPNDPRNNNGGIVNPTTITGGQPTPIPTGTIEGAPNVPMPTPNLSSGGSSSVGATPSGSTGTIPIPSIIP